MGEIVTVASICFVITLFGLALGFAFLQIQENKPPLGKIPTNFLRTKNFIFISSILIIGLILNQNESVKDSITTQTSSSSTNPLENFTFYLFFILTIFFTWNQLKKRFNKPRLFYEEASWYDGQFWEKPFSILKNDRFLSTQQIQPFLEKFFQHLLLSFFGNIVFLLSSLVARRAHNPKVNGSNPFFARKFFLIRMKNLKVLLPIKLINKFEEN
eukprot:gene4-5_t